MANSWRRERWDSLRLLTPNWLTRLPGHRYEGADPDGFMTMAEVIEFISRYASLSAAPVRPQTSVTSVTPADNGYRVATDRGDFRCRSLVVASGACNIPILPSVRQGVPSSIPCFTPADYRNPNQLPEGGVLIVGAAATGVQLADEIRRSGRPVMLSVGEHVRLPRMYRGRDVLWWMDASGVWNQRYDEIDDIERARKLPSPQLVGTPERATIDLNTLTAVGVELVGRLSTIRDGRALFSGGLRNQFALADLKMERLLDTFDEWARTNTRDADVGPSERFEPTRAPGKSRLELSLAQRRDPLDRLGHWIPARLPLARRAGCRSKGPAAAQRRRGGSAGTVRDRTAGAPAPQIKLHSRRRRRCPRNRRPSVPLSGGDHRRFRNESMRDGGSKTSLPRQAADLYRWFSANPPSSNTTPRDSNPRMRRDGFPSTPRREFRRRRRDRTGSARPRNDIGAPSSAACLPVRDWLPRPQLG